MQQCCQIESHCNLQVRSGAVTPQAGFERPSSCIARGALVYCSVVPWQALQTNLLQLVVQPLVTVSCPEALYCRVVIVGWLISVNVCHHVCVGQGAVCQHS